MWIQLATVVAGTLSGVLWGYSDLIGDWVCTVYGPESAGGISIPSSRGVSFPIAVSSLLTVAPIIIPFSMMLIGYRLMLQSDLENLTGPAFDVIFRFENREKLVERLKRTENLKETCVGYSGLPLMMLALFIGIIVALSLFSSIILTIVTFAWMMLRLTRVAKKKMGKQLKQILSRDVTPLMIEPIAQREPLGLFSGFLLVLSLFPIFFLAWDVDFLALSPDYLAIFASIYAYCLVFLHRLALRMPAFVELTIHGTSSRKIPRLVAGDIFLYILTMLLLGILISGVHSEVAWARFLVWRYRDPRLIGALELELSSKVFVASLAVVSLLALAWTYVRKGSSHDDLRKDRFRIPAVAVSSMSFAYFYNPLSVVIGIGLVIAFWALMRDAEQNKRHADTRAINIKHSRFVEIMILALLRTFSA